MRYYYLTDAGRPIRTVAFYDRASSAHQQRNNMRAHSCDEALRAARYYGWQLVRSFDERNGGICFLDVQSRGSFVRPELERATLLSGVDAIGLLYTDRLGESPAAQNLLGIARCRGKSVITFDALSRSIVESMLSREPLGW